MFAAPGAPPKSGGATDIDAEVTPPDMPPLVKSVSRATAGVWDHMVPAGSCAIYEQHMVHVSEIDPDCFNRHSGHSGWDHLPTVRDSDDPPVVDLKTARIVCDSELGGHVQSYLAAT
jgi:hypothetical protein